MGWQGGSLDSSSSDGADQQPTEGGAAAAGDAIVDVTVIAAHPLASSNLQGRLPPLRLPRPSGAAAPVSQPPAAGAGDPELTRIIIRSPSPAASVANLLNGTVACGAADFAAAAAAAAAAIAAETAGARGTDDQAAVAGAMNSAYEAAQASVTAIRGSSRVWGRRLQGLLRTSSSGAAEAAAGTPDRQPAVELGHVQAAGSAAGDGGRAAAVRSPELVMRVPSRGAISIYAYAGHPHAVDPEHGEVHEHTTQLQQEVHWGSVPPDVYLSGVADSSSTAVNHTSMLDSRDRPPSRQNASLPEVVN